MGFREKLREHLEWAEGYRETPYVDSLGVPTIGVGHNLRAKPLTGHILAWYRRNGSLSRELVYELLGQDMDEAIAGARSIFPQLDELDEARQVALVDLVFNMGAEKVRSFKRTIASVNEGNWEGAAKHLENSLWYRQVGRRSKRVVSLLRSGSF